MTEKTNKIIRNALFVVVIAFVFIFPVLSLVKMSFTTESGWGLENYIQLLQDTRTIRAIVNTIIISVCSTVIAVILGSIMAFLVAYTNLKNKKTIELLVLSPYIIPSYIITLSWSSLFSTKGLINSTLVSLGLPAINIYSLMGIILVMGICNVPIVYLLVINMLRKVPKDMEWAARASGFGIWDVVRKITLIQVMPAIASGGVLAFLAAIDNFSVPAFLGISSGIPVLSTYIYEKAISFGPSSFNLAAALSVILSFIAISGTLLQGKLIKKGSNMESVKEDYSVRIIIEDKKRKVLETILLVLLVLINIVPLCTMIVSSFFKNFGGRIKLEQFTLENFQFVFTNDGVYKAVVNSIVLALITCAVCILIGTVIAYMKIRKNSAAAKLLESAAGLTYALPGIVLALAMIFHWAKVPGVYGTVKILIIAYITRYMVLQIKGSTTALLSVEPSLEEAGRTCGSSPLYIWYKIIVPMIAKPVLSSSFLIFVSSMTELTLSSMLASAGTKTIGLTIFNLQQGGDYSLATAMSSVLVFAILIVYGISSRLKNEKKYEKNGLGLKIRKNVASTKKIFVGTKL